jgi:hypothetical protein
MKGPDVAQLSEWLQLMLAEIARKREEGELARQEEERRRAEEHAHAEQHERTRRAG